VLVQKGDQVSVTTGDGKVTKGSIEAVSESSLRLLRNRVPIEMAQMDVLEIKKKDPIANGVKMGALVGAGIGGHLASSALSFPAAMQIAHPKPSLVLRSRLDSVQLSVPALGRWLMRSAPEIRLCIARDHGPLRRASALHRCFRRTAKACACHSHSERPESNVRFLRLVNASDISG
jgi:hypothetical protein